MWREHHKPMFTWAKNSHSIARCLILVFALEFGSSLLAGQGIERTPVASSNLAAVGYDARAQVLEIEFLHGGCYRYFDVPKSIFAALMSAESKGRFFSTNIKDRFRFEKLRSTSKRAKQ